MFEASLVYSVCSRTARAIQINPVSKNQKKKKKKKEKKRKKKDKKLPKQLKKGYVDDIHTTEYKSIKTTGIIVS